MVQPILALSCDGEALKVHSSTGTTLCAGNPAAVLTQFQWGISTAGSEQPFP